jgi:hypothetical protein
MPNAASAAVSGVAGAATLKAAAAPRRENVARREIISEVISSLIPAPLIFTDRNPGPRHNTNRPRRRPPRGTRAASFIPP